MVSWIGVWMGGLSTVQLELELGLGLSWAICTWEKKVKKIFKFLNKSGDFLIEPLHYFVAPLYDPPCTGLTPLVHSGDQRQKSTAEAPFASLSISAVFFYLNRCLPGSDFNHWNLVVAPVPLQMPVRPICPGSVAAAPGADLLSWSEGDNLGAEPSLN